MSGLGVGGSYVPSAMALGLAAVLVHHLELLDLAELREVGLNY